MNHEIIYTDEYALIVSDEEIKKGDYIFCIEDVKDDLKIERVSIRTIHWLVNSSIFKKVIAHRPLTDAPILEGVPLLPEFSQGDDVEKEAKDYADNSATCDYEEGINVGKYQGFIEGYKKAKETYKYTEEDLIKAIELAQTPSDYDSFPLIDEVIQSLQQLKRPKYFEMSYSLSKVNIEGDYIKEPKTITNSEGQTELVGEYIY